MEVLRKITVLLAGSVVYLFILTITGEMLQPEVLEKLYIPVTAAAVLAGFMLNSYINRFLFGLCPVRAVIFSFFSLVLLAAAAFMTVG
ncbi:hypothetical protein [Persephonella sp.]